MAVRVGNYIISYQGHVGMYKIARLDGGWVEGEFNSEVEAVNHAAQLVDASIPWTASDRDQLAKELLCMALPHVQRWDFGNKEYREIMADQAYLMADALISRSKQP